MRMTKSRNKKAVEKTDAAFYAQVRDVFVQARQFVHKTANFAMVKAYWLVGKMIVEKQGGEAKAAYGDRLIASLSIQLTADLGKGFTQANLRYMRLFYLAFRNCHTLCDELSWSHLHNKRIFAAKYKLHLPSEQELIAELRRERTAIEDAQLVTKLDQGETRRIKKSAFGAGGKARGVV